jgi:hypothetical protein
MIVVGSFIASRKGFDFEDTEIVDDPEMRRHIGRSTPTSSVYVLFKDFVSYLIGAVRAVVEYSI